MQVNMKGTYKLCIKNKETNEKRLITPYIDNLILDSFINNAHLKWAVSCRVGTDDSAVVPTQSGVINEIARTNLISSDNQSFIKGSNVIWESTHYFKFTNLNGESLREIGIGDVTRSLIDPLYNIRVNNDEYLEVYYRFTVIADKNPIQYSINGSNIIIKPRALPIRVGDFLIPSSIRTDVKSIDSAYHLTGSSSEVTPFSHTVKTIGDVFNISISLKNVTNIKTLYLPYNLGYWAIEFDNPITTEDKQTLKLELNLGVQNAT